MIDFSFSLVNKDIRKNFTSYSQGKKRFFFENTGTIFLLCMQGYFLNILKIVVSHDIHFMARALPIQKNDGIIRSKRKMWSV